MCAPVVDFVVFVDHLVDAALRKKYIEFVMYHFMYSLLWNKGPWIVRPFNVSSRRLFHMFIYLACLVFQFSSCPPRISILCSFSKLLGGARTCWNIPNCNWTLSDWCLSTIAKQIRDVHAVQISASLYASSGIDASKSLYGFHLNCSKLLLSENLC